MASTLPQFNVKIDSYDVEADSHLVQQGEFARPGFFGNIQGSAAHAAFMQGVNTALSYGGFRSYKEDLVDEREDGTPYRLTKAEYSELQKKARSISTYSKIPYDTCEDFLLILCFVDDPADMEKIAECVQIPELTNPNILRKPMQILAIRGLEKVSFAAQALDGLVNLFRKYIKTSQNAANKGGGEDMGKMLNSISNLIGGFGQAQEILDRIQTGDMGSFMSEMITGTRIPTNVIAKNPMMQAPSYIGKAFFGEAPNPLANVDIDQLFNKPIAAFSQFQAGTGTSAFSMQNFGTFSREMSLDSFVAKVTTGSAELGSARKIAQVKAVVDKINDMTGSKSTDIVDVTRADNALPIMMAMSTQFSGFDKSIFCGSVFQNGWATAQSVGSVLSSSNPSFIEAARRFL